MSGWALWASLRFEDGAVPSSGQLSREGWFDTSCACLGQEWEVRYTTELLTHLMDLLYALCEEIADISASLRVLSQSQKL